MKISKSTLKRHCLRYVPHADDRLYPRVEGTFDAVADARRHLRLRGKSALTPHPDHPDFFGIRRSDSPSGADYVDAFNEAIDTINGLTRRLHRRIRRFRKDWASQPAQQQDEF
jgi:hypothetical protein